MSTTLLDAARAYLDHGYQPIPVPPGEKGPVMLGWQRLRLTADQLPAHFNGDGNIGLLLGAPSAGLVDVDLDCPEAIKLAEQYLPPTQARTGRPGKPESHWWYLADDVQTKQHKDPVTKAMIVELRSTGAQTLVGPSIHPSGDVYDVLEAEPARVPAPRITAAVAALADAIKIARHGAVKPIPKPPTLVTTTPVTGDVEQRAAAYLDAMPPAISGQGGHDKAYAAATAMVHGFGMSTERALALLLGRYNPACQPEWTESELRHKVEDAANKPHDRPLGWLRDAQQAEDLGGVDLSQFMVGNPPAETDTPCSVTALLASYPKLRTPVIHGLLREGETMNIIAPPKTGKSWLVLGLAMTVATGRQWLDTFDAVPGNVLILDNELHGETLANRIPKVAAAMGIGLDEIGETVFVQSLRGQLRDIISLRPYFDSIEPGRFSIIVLDAFYRFMPAGSDENDNAGMAAIYNQIDALADRLECCFVLIHHASKGNQASKVVTDVGAGAGSQSRATDTHLVLRAHEEPGAIVLDAAVRSWPPIAPTVLRWDFPVWRPDPELDPEALRRDRPKREKKEKPAKLELTPEQFVEAFVPEPLTKAVIIGAATQGGLSERKAKELFAIALSENLLHRWSYDDKRQVPFAAWPEPERKVTK